MSARADLPDGTVTMVFTDIVGSTVLLRDLGDRYAGVLAAHRQRVRAIVERHDGSEVGTQGDAFFLVFRRASDAIGAAGEIAAESPGDEPIEVRIGVHTGDPTRHDDDYVGMDVHVAARIAAAGSGGQVLVSRQTRELIPHEALRDLGVHRLKDVGEIHLFQLGDHGFPPVRSIGGSNLASPHEAPLGRDGEMAELRALVTGDGVRLITLTGPGGIGKTTVARALASGLGDRFPDGTWFVDLLRHRQRPAGAGGGARGRQPGSRCRPPAEPHRIADPRQPRTGPGCRAGHRRMGVGMSRTGDRRYQPRAAARQRRA